MACRPAPSRPISAARSGTAAVDRASIDSPLVVTAVGVAVDATFGRRVTGCAASMEGRAALAGGASTAHGVLPSAMGPEQRSSVGHSRGGSSDRLAVGGHRRLSERKSSSLPATRSQGRPGGHAAMQPPTSETPMDPNEAVYLHFMCDYVFM